MNWEIKVQIKHKFCHTIFLFLRTIELYTALHSYKILTEDRSASWAFFSPRDPGGSLLAYTCSSCLSLRFTRVWTKNKVLILELQNDNLPELTVVICICKDIKLSGNTCTLSCAVVSTQEYSQPHEIYKQWHRLSINCNDEW